MIVRRFAVAIVLVILAGLIVYYVPDYRVLVLTKALAFSGALAGLALVSGYSGQISLGQSVFFGLGAYLSAILTGDHGVPFLWTLPITAIAGFVIGLGVGIPALRIRGLYLALVTGALATLFPVLVKRFDSQTGGASGKVLQIEWVPPDWLQITETSYRFLTVAAVTVLIVGVAYALAHSAVGRSLLAMSDNEIAAAASGIDTTKARVLAFGASAAMGGCAGSLYVFTTTVVSPDSFTLTLSIAFISAMVLTGGSSILGCVLGGLFLAYLPDLSAGWSRYVPLVNESQSGVLANAIYGIVLVVVIMTMPDGVVPAVLRQGRRRIRQRSVPRRPIGAGAHGSPESAGASGSDLPLTVGRAVAGSTALVEAEEGT